MKSITAMGLGMRLGALVLSAGAAFAVAPAPVMALTMPAGDAVAAVEGFGPMVLERRGRGRGADDAPGYVARLGAFLLGQSQRDIRLEVTELRLGGWTQLRVGPGNRFDPLGENRGQ